MGQQQLRTVLIVDDDFGIVDALRDLLQDMDWTVLTATSGGEALRLLRGGCTPSVIISDVMMPGVNGLDLLRQVQAIPRLQQVPFIEMTASNTRRKSPGAAAFLPKPFSLADVMNVLELAIAAPNDRAKSGTA